MKTFQINIKDPKKVDFIKKILIEFGMVETEPGQFKFSGTVKPARRIKSKPAKA